MWFGVILRKMEGKQTESDGFVIEVFGHKTNIKGKG